MADIDVVPRRKTNVWLWVILAIIVIAICWWALGRSHNTATTELRAPMTHVAVVARAVVRSMTVVPA